MTNHFTITTIAPNEAPPETPKAAAFPSLLASVLNVITAERDLADISYSQDPAYSAWLREAELAQDSLTDALRHFHALPLVIPADRPLQRMATLVDTMLGHEDPGGARQLHRKMQMAFFTSFQVQGIGTVAMRHNGMLIQARHLVAALAALPLFDATHDAIDDAHSTDSWDIATF